MTISTKIPVAAFPWNWLEELDPKLLELEGIPLSSQPKGFSKEAFEKILSKHLAQPSALVEILDPVVFDKGSNNNKYATFAVPGVDGTLTLTVPRGEVESLLLYLVQNDRVGSTTDEFLDPFWDFFVGTLKNAFLESFESSPLALEERGSIPPESPALSFPLAFTVGKERFSGSLIASDLFLKNWRRSNLKAEKKGRLTAVLAQRVEVPLDLVIGGVELTKSDWKSLDIGDTLFLDHLTFPPSEEKGDGILFFEEQPLYRVKVKLGAIKFLEPARGVKIFMPLERQDPAKPLTPPLPEDETAHDETLAAPDEENEEEEEATKKLQDRGPPLPLPDIPLLIRVELGRFSVPLHDLLELQEGNILKLDVDPRKGVDLVVEGKVIGRGELVAIGELFGVRITDLE